MNTSIEITLGELGWFLIGIAVIIMIVYITILIKNLIPAVKKMNSVLEDIEIITNMASQSTKNVQIAINNLSESASILSDSVKNNQNVVIALATAINAVTSLKNILMKIFKSNSG